MRYLQTISEGAARKEDTTAHPHNVGGTSRIKVNIAAGGNSFVGLGDICSFMNKFTVLISSLLWSSEAVVAVCHICIVDNSTLKNVIMDSELRCPPSRLFSTSGHKFKLSHAVSKRIKEIIHGGMEAVRKCSDGESVGYRSFLRRCRIGSYIHTHIMQTLSGSAFKHSFDFAINDLDFVLFGLSNENNYTMQYDLSNLNRLDHIFFKEWDVFYKSTDPSAKFVFVSKIRFKAEARRIVVHIQKAICNMPFDENYRLNAINYSDTVNMAVAAN